MTSYSLRLNSTLEQFKKCSQRKWKTMEILFRRLSQNQRQSSVTCCMSVHFLKKPSFVLGQSQLTMLRQFQVNHEGTQPFIDTCTHNISYTLSGKLAFLGDSKGQGSLMCCSPWGRKESDTTERLNNIGKVVLPMFLKFHFSEQNQNLITE